MQNWTEEAGVSFHLSSLSDTYNDPSVIGSFNEGQTNMSFGKCASTKSETNPYVRVDLGQSRVIKSIFLLTGYDPTNESYSISTSQLYVGNNETRASGNTVCHKQVHSTGFFDCQASGRYIWLELQGTGQLMMCNIQAF